MSETNLNQLAWISLFDKYDIFNQLEQHNFFNITSTQINEFREARLMTKFDNTSQLPNIFYKHGIGILPISRGTYTLGKFNIFHKFEEISDEVEHYRFCNIYESLDFNNISSESTAISCASISKILDDFIGEELVPTVSGRMGTSTFEFSLDKFHTKKIKVEKAQIEIDGGYEGEKSFVLIEAKNYISDDFIIRQLYYPFRKWKETIQKKVKSIYLTYSNGIFELREYAFTDIEGYNSINLVKSKRYAIYNIVINVEIIQELILKTTIEPEPMDTPFPQADSFDRVINLCELINTSEILGKDEITENYDFDSRQTDYYLNACKYLGLAEKGYKDEVISAFLSPKGKEIFKKDISSRRLDFIKLIISKVVFRKTLELYFNKASMPTKDEVVLIMKESKLNNIASEETYSRRASTVLGWTNWIIGQIEE
jgi:hypothetical protein